MIAGLALLAQLAVVARAPDSTATCTPTEITVAVSAPRGTSPMLVPGGFTGLDVLRSSPTPVVTPASHGENVAEYKFIVSATRPGKYAIGPFEVRAGNVVVRSAPRTLLVAPREVVHDPEIVARARVDTSFAVKVGAIAKPETVYVGQQVNYEVAVFLNDVVRDRMRRAPTFFPPEMRSMLGYDMPAPLPDKGADSRCFDALVYQRALFPLMPGRFAIPPAQMTYSLPLSSSFYSGEESHDLQTDSAIVVALDPPVAGRPADFIGAVGRLRASARVDSARARVGDPTVLTLRVEGEGNVKLLPRPDLRLPWASSVTGQERVSVDTLGHRVRGAKEFDWILTPRIAGELDVPPIRYPYFDPGRAAYDVAVTDALALHVAPGTLAALDTTSQLPRLTIRRSLGAPASQPPVRLPVYWALLAVAPLSAAGAQFRRRRVLRPRPNRPDAPLRRVVRARHADARAVRRAFIAAVSERIGASPQAFTKPGALERALRRSGVSRPVAADAERLLRALDAAAFSAGGAAPPGVADDAMRIYTAADAEALPHAEIRLPPSLVLVIVMGATLLVTGTAMALEQRAAAAEFVRGVAAYDRADWVNARAAFAAVATDEPRATDAWVDLGTTAWAQADTAVAAVAWQRAMRLDPTADDVRDRLALVHAPDVGDAGWVPPLSPIFLGWVVLVLWSFGWGAIAWRRWRFRAPSSRLAGVSTIAAILVGAGGVVLALDLAEAETGRHLAAVRTGATLRRAPALVAEASSAVGTGEIARVDRREGGWTHVTLDGAREGWLSADALYLLDAPPPRD